MKHCVPHRSQHSERKPHIDQRETCAQREADWLMVGGGVVLGIHGGPEISVRRGSVLSLQGDPRRAASRRAVTAGYRASGSGPQRAHRGRGWQRSVGLLRQARREMTRCALDGRSVLAKLEKPWHRLEANPISTASRKKEANCMRQYAVLCCLAVSRTVTQLHFT
jgi:hypothetical protein